jgi:hypothetical protein
MKENFARSDSYSLGLSLLASCTRTTHHYALSSHASARTWCGIACSLVIVACVRELLREVGGARDDRRFPGEVQEHSTHQLVAWGEVALWNSVLSVRASYWAA